ASAVAVVAHPRQMRAIMRCAFLVGDWLALTLRPCRRRCRRLPPEPGAGQALSPVVRVVSPQVSTSYAEQNIPLRAAAGENHDMADRDGDGWTECARGHRHRGLHGASGLLAVHHDD